MLPDSMAITWFGWRRHQHAILLIVFGLLTIAILSAVLPPYCSPEAAKNVFGLLIMVPLCGMILCLFAVFSYGSENGDLLARESCFPPQLFRLPVRTASLVLGPMLLGGVAASAFWVLSSWFIVRPWMSLLDGAVPLWWPALFLATSLAWLQTLLWSPFGLRALRIFLFSCLAIVLINLGIWAGHSGIAEGYFVVLFATLTIAAWMLGYVGVVHARRGDVPNWEALLRPLQRLVHWLPKRGCSFASAIQAQGWYEWRLAGKTLAFSTFLVLPAVLLPLPWGDNDTLPIMQTLLSAIATPVFLAGLSGKWPGVGRGPRAKKGSSMMPFIATLPISSAGLVGAMLKEALWSTLLAYGVVIVIVPLATVVTGNLEVVMKILRNFTEGHPPGQIAVMILATAVLLLVWTWKRKVDALYLHITGRTWVPGLLVWFGLPGSIVLLFLAGWLYQRRGTEPMALNLLPWILGFVVLCRILLASWALANVRRQRLVQGRTLARWLAGWFVLATVLSGLLAWATPSELVPTYYVVLAVLFAMPMARLAATPLALAWDRHR